ncbi:AbrB/MazE/SpoVT family DNA-binding domain-containing protein [Candidatus Woesearchaeota archaeon]|nr:MAG: AbrB/MazE/SpoVT family DNA-binding domain-containing protein [Candidatus Woesearchaeota archaeon]
MKRKVNLVGQNTLTVSLPSAWAKKHNIKQGDELDVEEEGMQLRVSKEKTEKKRKKVTLNIDGLNKITINRYLWEFYRQGVEEITLVFSNELIPDYKREETINVHTRIKRVIERFIGVEIVSQKKNCIVLQTLILQEDYEKSDIILQRIYYLLKDYLDEFIASMDTFKEFHEKSYDLHDNITKFCYYYLRLLQYANLEEDKKMRLFSLFMVLDKILDKLRHTAEQVVLLKRKEHIKKILKELFTFFLEQFDVILKKQYSKEQLNALVKKRYALMHKVNREKFTLEEFKVIAECKILLDTINDFSETYIALHMEEYC